MKKSFFTALGALIGGLLAGFLVFELVVRALMQLMDTVSVALIGTLANALPIGGAVLAVVLVRRRRK